MPHFHEQPSLWVQRYAPLIRPGGTVLDLASGVGRNARWLAGHGWNVVAVDHDAQSLATLAGIPNISTIQADIENHAWPFPAGRFDAIVVCRYLYRPLLPTLAECLNEGGILIYETFMTGQEGLGSPRNPDFLLQPNELLHVYSDKLQTIAFEQGLIAELKPAFLQRICSRR